MAANDSTFDSLKVILPGGVIAPGLAMTQRVFYLQGRHRIEPSQYFTVAGVEWCATDVVHGQAPSGEMMTRILAETAI